MSLRIDIPDCNECGACCGANEPKWVEVTEADRLRLGHSSLVEPGDIEPWAMRVQDGPLCQCIAWRGTVGKESICTVYENRPEACRTFEPGSPGCIYMLGLRGIRSALPQRDE